MSPEQPLFLTPTRMSLGSGRERRLRSWVLAVGVSDMAALRGRSLVMRFGFGCEGVSSEGAIGLVFWASASVSLILWVPCCWGNAEDSPY